MLFEADQKQLSERAQEIAREYARPGSAQEKNAPISEFITRNMGLFGEAQPISNTSQYLAAAKGWVYACVDAIADEIGAIDLHLYKLNGKKVTEVVDSPILNLLYRANDFTTKFDMFRLMQQYLELAGEAPLYVAMDGNQPTDLLLLRPDRLTVIPGKGTEIIAGYKYRPDGGREINLTKDEVVFIKNPDPTRTFRGAGTLEAVAKTVDIDNFSEDFNRKFFYNGATPGAVLQTEQKLTAETLENLRSQTKRLYAGIDNAHKTMILQQGLEWKPLQLSQKDMDFLEQQRFSRDKILAVFRVPKSVLGITDDVNRANAEATDYIFAKRTVKPKMTRLVEQLNEFLLPLFPGSENLELRFTDPVPENTETKIKVYETGLRNGYYTINEVRSKEGLKSIGPAGDTVYLPFSVQAIDDVNAPTDSNPDEQKLFNSIQRSITARGRKGIKTKELKEKVKKDLYEKLTPVIMNMLGHKGNQKTINKFKVLKVKTDQIQEEAEESAATDEEAAKKKFWEMKIAKTNKIEADWIKRNNKLFDQQMTEVLGSTGTKATISDIADWLLNVTKETKKTKKLFKPIMSQAVAAGGQDAYDMIGLDDELDISNPRVQKFLEKRSFQFSEEITEETNSRLGKTLADGIEKGEGIPELRKRVEDLFDGMKQSRSETIARSEVIRATNYGTDEAYKESGIVESKEWLVAFDERTCPYCLELQGKIVDLDEDFAGKGDNVGGMQVEYENVGAPPLHPNCRCTIIPKVKK